MEITGRITKDASVFKVNGEREVVNFSIAVNDSYKPKGASEFKKIVTYIECSYWLSSKIAQWLKKGALVELFGRIGCNAYIGSDAQAHGSLTFHTSHIKILAFQKGMQDKDVTNIDPEKDPDDLPF